MQECFVIMPFGEKTAGKDGVTIDFDKIYSELIAPAVEQASLMPQRSDKDRDAVGDIKYDMMRSLAYSPVALFDGTFHNPNAFYELGVRHSFRNSVTIGIRADGWAVPYDVNSFPFFTYRLADGELVNPDEQVQALKEHILQCLHHRSKDSPVLKELGAVANSGLPPIVLDSNYSIFYEISEKENTKIGIRTGDLKDVKGIDAWVNSENDRMQMARVVERTISSTIRYLGARIHDGTGDVVQDHIADNLGEAVLERLNHDRPRGQSKYKKGAQPKVKLGWVVSTAPGRLSTTHNVKRIFHVATVTGDYMKRFKAGPDIADYVFNVLIEIDNYNRDPKNRKNSKMKSVLIPTFGTGHGGGSIEMVADLLVSGACRAFAELSERNKPTLISQVEFLAFDSRTLHALEFSLQKHQRAGNVGERSGPKLSDLC